jgi:hypothetical protein
MDAANQATAEEEEDVKSTDEVDTASPSTEESKSDEKNDSDKK